MPSALVPFSRLKSIRHSSGWLLRFGSVELDLLSVTPLTYQCDFLEAKAQPQSYTVPGREKEAIQLYFYCYDELCELGFLLNLHFIRFWNARAL